VVAVRTTLDRESAAAALSVEYQMPLFVCGKGTLASILRVVDKEVLALPESLSHSPLYYFMDLLMGINLICRLREVKKH
jgi:hypothetical protein